jgi:hypothetical protein|tara:strand:- start:266 stop:730 length:465 start_codon:yes stop_codon:yes gene_type:complete
MSGIINSVGARSGVIGTTELDYEEGTFTATLAGSDPPDSTVARTAYYTKIGRQVLVSVNYESVSVVGATGAVEISGMPFTAFAIDPGNAFYNGTVQTKYFSYSSGTNVQPYMTGGTTVLRFSTSGSGAAVGGFNYSQSPSGTDKYFRVSFLYLT